MKKLKTDQIERILAKYLLEKFVNIKERDIMDYMAGVLGVELTHHDSYRIHSVVYILRNWYHAGVIGCNEGSIEPVKFWVIASRDLEDIANGVL